MSDRRRPDMMELLAIAWIVLAAAIALGHHWFPAKVSVPPQLMPLTLATVGVVLIGKISDVLHARFERRKKE